MEISKLMNTDRLFKVFSSPFLGTFFQLENIRLFMVQCTCFRPLSWGLSFNDGVKLDVDSAMDNMFSSPFLGTFFQSSSEELLNTTQGYRFRPLSWGLSFNDDDNTEEQEQEQVFVPFLGDFLSIGSQGDSKGYPLVFVPFLGDFLSIIKNLQSDIEQYKEVFVPFLGDFLSIKEMFAKAIKSLVFVPFLGDFLSIVEEENEWNFAKLVFVPFLGDFLSICFCYHL